jgi:hypothetical protein
MSPEKIIVNHDGRILYHSEGKMKPRLGLIQWLVGWNLPEVAHRSGDPFISGPAFPDGTRQALMVLKSEYDDLRVECAEQERFADSLAAENRHLVKRLVQRQEVIDEMSKEFDSIRAILDAHKGKEKP